MSYSPKPWKWENLAIRTQDGTPLFFLAEWWGVPAEEEVGNIRLATAAPELFAAAVAVLDMFPDDVAPLRALRAAVSKAKGE